MSESTSRSWASSEAARSVMKSNRGRDTSPERAVRSAVHARGLRYRVDARPVQALRRKADLVFRPAKVAVFVDGCFWHGCPQHGTAPRTNRDYWSSKIQGNKARDAETDEALRQRGWVPLRVWEHEDPERAAERIAQTVTSRRRHESSM